jgi:diaminopimelate decarboxylase
MEIKYFDLSGTELLLNGEKVTDFITAAGGTPVYLYSKEVIKSKVAELRNCLPKSVKIYYAAKANPHPEIIAYLNQLVDGFDIASINELNICLASLAKPHNISFAGPGKSNQELAVAIENNILLNVESLNEIKRIEKQQIKLNKKARIALRINPNFDLKNSGMKMSGGAKPFGIDSELIPEIINYLNNTGLNLEGFHIYSGSQSLDADVICEMQNQAVALIKTFIPYLKTPIKSLNLGGGFGIPYFKTDHPLDLEKIKNHSQILTEKIYSNFGMIDVIIEIGRFLVGESGIYITKIIDKKKSRGQTFIITDGGMNHHLAASGNLGQIIKKNYPIYILNKLNSHTKEVLNIAGPLCTPLDQLANQITLDQCEVGDLVGIFQSGAYGFTASPLYFLSHPLPKEIIF